MSPDRSVAPPLPVRGEAQGARARSPSLDRPAASPVGDTLSVLTVVVTHDRPAVLEKCLVALANQTRPPEGILVVDNASGQETGRLLGAWRSVHTLRLDVNKGGAGGFAAGLRWSYAYGYDWTWMMDDDAIPERTALETLLPSMRRHHGELVALASRTVEASSEQPYAPAARAESRVDHAMFVGFAVSRRVVQELGVPREDFFIYTDDSDYCWRIQRAGGAVYRVPGSVIVHADWASAPANLTLDIAGRRILLYPRVAGWKKYYLARNRIIAARSRSPGRAVIAVLQSLAFALATVAFAPRDLGLVVWGLVDGLRLRAGARVHPN